MSRQKTRRSRRVDGKNEGTMCEINNVPFVLDIVRHAGGLTFNEFPTTPGTTLSNPEAKARASGLDRDWFQANSNRSYRIRRAIPGEIPWAPEGEEYTVVRQVRPGFRLRRSFSTAPALPEGDAPEHIAHAIFDLVEEYNGRPVAHADVSRRIGAYADRDGPADRSNGPKSTVH